MIPNPTLQEASYKSPKTFNTLFWDFYALYNLWWTYGSGRQAYGGHLPADPRAGGLGQKVDYAFEECTLMMASTLLTLMQANIEDEARNGEDDLYAAPEKVEQWCYDNGMQDCLGPDGFTAPTMQMLRKGNPSMSTMAQFFLAPFWGDMDSGWRRAFGDKDNIGVSVGANGHTQVFDVAGPNWARLCNLTGNLMAAKKARSTPKMLAAIDALMHAEHNNGSIFNRPPVTKRGIKFGKKELDARRDAMSSRDFLPYVSPFVKNLTNALEPVRTEEAYTFLASNRLVDTLLEAGDPVSQTLPEDLQARITALGFTAWVEVDHPYFVVHLLDPQGMEAAELPPYLTHDEAVAGLAQAIAVIEEGD